MGFVPVYDEGGAWADVRVLRLERVRVKSLAVGADELKMFLAERVKGLEIADLTLEKTVRIAGSYRGCPVNAEASLELLDWPRRLKINLLSASIARVSVPVSIFREITFVIPISQPRDAVRNRPAASRSRTAS